MNLFLLLEEAATATNYGIWIMFIVMVVLLVVVMLYSSRTQKKRQKEAEERMNSIRVGDRIKTIGGICGIVVEVNDEENTFVLETGVNNSGNFIKFDKVAMYQVEHAVTPEEKPAEEGAVFAEETETVEPAKEGAEAEDAPKTDEEPAKE